MEDYLRLNLSDCLAICEKLQQHFPKTTVVRQPNGQVINFIVPIETGLSAEFVLTEEVPDLARDRDYLMVMELIRENLYEHQGEATSITLRRLTLVHYTLADDKIGVITQLILSHLMEMFGKLTQLEFGQQVVQP